LAFPNGKEYFHHIFRRVYITVPNHGASIADIHQQRLAKENFMVSNEYNMFFTPFGTQVNFV
jgi:hypothetical protein